MCGLPGPHRERTTTLLPSHEDTALCRERSRACRMTTLDHASAESGWRPILSGTKAEQALQAVDAIAESIPSLPAGRDPSLGRGQAGLALLYAWLARTRRMPQADVLARQCLGQAIGTGSVRAYDGCLVGW